VYGFLNNKNLVLKFLAYKLSKWTYLKVGHQHKVSSFVPLVVEGKVIDVAEHGARLNALILVVNVNIPTQTIHDFQAFHLTDLQFRLVSFHLDSNRNK